MTLLMAAQEVLALRLLEEKRRTVVFGRRSGGDEEDMCSLYTYCSSCSESALIITQLKIHDTQHTIT
jgi:hypothetical protein